MQARERRPLQTANRVPRLASPQASHLTPGKAYFPRLSSFSYLFVSSAVCISILHYTVCKKYKKCWSKYAACVLWPDGGNKTGTGERGALLTANPARLESAAAAVAGMDYASTSAEGDALLGAAAAAVAAVEPVAARTRSKMRMLSGEGSSMTQRAEPAGSGTNLGDLPFDLVRGWCAQCGALSVLSKRGFK